MCEYYQCIGMSTMCLFIGLVLGMLLQKLRASLRLDPRISDKTDTSFLSQLEPEYGLIVDSMQVEPEGNQDDIENTEMFDEELRDKRAWRRRGSQSSDFSQGSCSVNYTKSMLSLRGTLFANSMRKLSTMSGRQHGLIEARGQVRVEYGIHFTLPGKSITPRISNPGTGNCIHRCCYARDARLAFRAFIEPRSFSAVQCARSAARRHPRHPPQVADAEPCYYPFILLIKSI